MRGGRLSLRAEFSFPGPRSSRDRKECDSDRREPEREVPSNVTTCPVLLPWEGQCYGRGPPLIFSDFKPCAGFLAKMVSVSESVLTPDVPRLIIDDKETHGCSSPVARAALGRKAWSILGGSGVGGGDPAAGAGITGGSRPAAFYLMSQIDFCLTFSLNEESAIFTLPWKKRALTRVL